MSKLSILATAFLFWTILATSLIRVELVAAPVRKAHVPTFRSMPIRASVLMPPSPTNITYN
ncbi:MAG: hypothetical protein M3Y54_12815 [Bacteroidota bacterium]|nr:hypothetical protein [Bacteroidota bacterium]